MEEEIREILLNHWDPLAIGELPAARDEYDENVRTLAAWLERGPISFADMRQYLDYAAYELSPTFDEAAKLDTAARMLVALVGDRS